MAALGEKSLPWADAQRPVPDTDGSKLLTSRSLSAQEETGDVASGPQRVGFASPLATPLIPESFP